MAGVTRTCDYCNTQLWDEETGNHECEEMKKQVVQTMQRRKFPRPNVDNYQIGVLPPPNAEWQVGKTAATIAFVNSLEQYLAEDGLAQSTNRVSSFLKRAVELAKRGELQLTNALGI